MVPDTVSSVDALIRAELPAGGRRRCRGAGRRGCGRWRRRRTARATSWRAASPMRRRASGSSAKRCSAAASAPTSSTGTSNPVSPSRTISPIAPTSVETNGSPTAPASDSTIGRQSPIVGRQNTSARWYSSMSGGLFGVSPWWARTPSWSGTSSRVTRSSSIATPAARSRRIASSSTKPPLRSRSPPTNSTRSGPASSRLAALVPPVRRPAFVVDARRDHHDLVGRHLVAVDETLLRPRGPRHDLLGVGEARLVGPPLQPLHRPAAGVVAVVGAELVVLDRRGVERHDRRHPLDVVGREDRRHLGVDEHGVERATFVQAADRPAGADPGAHRPVAETGHVGGPAVDVEGDGCEDGLDRLVGADEVLEVVRVGDVPERLLEHEADSRPQRPPGVLILEHREHALTGPELVGHAAVVGEVVQRAQRLLGHRPQVQRARRPGRCPSARRSRRAAAAAAAHRCGSTPAPGGGGRGTRWRSRRAASAGRGRARRSRRCGRTCGRCRATRRSCARRGGRRWRPWRT